jgi:hypothetical protein
LSRWQSEEAFSAAIPTILSLAPQRDPAWGAKPDEAIRVVEV